ncbi:MAG TPA: zf-HC2 domain-containing protein [Vicinamibacterales bacterium]|nr:zf-HC2 domain-containing protein [Vicinamibacterales bacterium]
MNCREMSQFLDEYFAGELPEAVATEFNGHITRCDDCTVYIEQYRRVITTGRAVRNEDEMCECPEELIQAIMAALRAADR